MKKKLLVFIPASVAILLIVYSQSLETEEKPIEVKKIEKVSSVQNLEIQQESNLQSLVELTDEKYLFRVFADTKKYNEKDGKISWRSGIVNIKPEFQELYDEVGVRVEPQNTVVIYPIFTASAYKSPGFYDYYNKQCDQSCLTTKIEATLDYGASGIGIQVLALLGYEIVNDLYIDQNPEKLKDYDKVIVLHNEYVTKIEFDAITSHPKVMYLYPNANYAEVEADYEAETITLIRGHGYQNVSNAFEWEFDNSKFEFDTDCNEWKFHEIDNGVMLNCYPENQILIDKELLRAIKEF